MEDGEAGIGKIEESREESGERRVESVIEQNVDWLNAIVELCDVHGVKPVIVQMPVMAEYKRMLPEEQVELYKEVLSSLDSCAICIDASEWEIPEDGWYNATHLTREASVEFTRKVKEDAGL